MNRLLVCLVAVVLVAGCGGERSPSKASPATRAPAATASPVIEPAPDIPPAARADSAAGARAFVHYFLALHNHAMRTGETASLRDALAPECFMCLTVPALIESAYRAGGRITGGLWIPTTEIHPVPSSEPALKDMGFFEVNVHLQPMTTLAAGNRETAALAGSSHDRTLLIWTSWRGGQWYVTQLNGVSGQQL